MNIVLDAHVHTKGTEQLVTLQGKVTVDLSMQEPFISLAPTNKSKPLHLSPHETFLNHKVHETTYITTYSQAYIILSYVTSSTSIELSFRVQVGV